MTNKKISALSSASTPLTGSEIVPINQSSVTDSVSVTNLTAGRSVSASDYVMSTGNLVPSTAAKGINFTANTPASGMTSQLLNWYEEGTWTPNQGAGLVVVGAFTSSGKYTRVGRLVTVEASLSGATSIACSAGTILCTNLPFAVNSLTNGVGSSSKGVTLGGTVLALGGGTTTVYTSTTYTASASLIYFTVTYSV